jgi:DNA polymerase III alpha subunit (gram-positive type)
MRQLVIDTETTGLHPERGHRVIEVAAVELVERRLTGKTLRFVIDPEREIDEEAAKIHGKSWADLKGEARFADVAQELRGVRATALSGLRTARRSTSRSSTVSWRCAASPRARSSRRT